MIWKHSVRACVALGWMVSCAGCDIATQVASVGRADAAVRVDGAADSGPLPCSLDLDGDGEIDLRCPAGTDCEDGDPSVGQDSDEQCGNASDDDCDARIDEADCTPPRGSTCEAPTVLTASARVEAIMFPWGDAATLSCVSPLTPHAHHVLRVDLEEPRSVRLRTAWPAGDWSGASLAHVTSCGSEGGSCGAIFSPDITAGGESNLAFARLPAGTHFFEVQTSGSAPSYPVDVRIEPVVSLPANDVCAGATPIPDESGVHTYEADFFAATAGDEGCGVGPDRADLFYSLDLASPADVTVDVSGTPGRYAVSVQSGSCGATSEVRCVDDIREPVLVRALGAGRHVLAVSGPRSGSATLTVTLEPPAPVLPGETCADPIRLVPGTTVTDTFAGRDLDIPETQCGLPDLGGPPLRDIVYDFVLAESSDVEIVVEGPAVLDARMRPSVASIERVCGEIGSVPAQRCAERLESNVTRTRVAALAAGRYFVTVSGELGSAVSVSLVVGAVVPPTVVADNRDCASAFAVDTSHGRRTLVGRLAAGEEAFFRVELSTASRIDVYGPFAHSVNLTSGCPETGPRGRGGWRSLGSSLEPGTYLFVLVNEWGDPPPGFEPLYEIAFEIGGGT